MMPRQTLWTAVFLPLILAVGVGNVRPAAAAPPPPVLLLFPHTLGDAADSRALVSLRARLRADAQFSVVTFDPEAPSLVRAAAEAQHPEWLTSPVTTDGERLSIARALGASYAADIAHADQSKADVHLLETGTAARVWDYVAYPTDAAADSIERDANLPIPVVPPSPALPSPAVPQATVLPPTFTKPIPAPAPVVPGAIAPPPAVPPKAVPAFVPPPTTSPPPPGAVAPELGAGGDSEIAANLAAVQPLIRQADQAVARGDMVDAYALYRQAINAAPLSDVPRLKLAQAYALGGLPDKALSEAQRALEISPDSLPVQEFLIKFDAENGTSAGTVARYRALVIKNPEDVTAHLDLGDALWNSSAYADAETEYKSARDIAPADSEARRVAIAHLARLYAAQGRYDDCLAAMMAAGDSAYPLVLGVLQNAADTLPTTIDSAHDNFDSGKLTRADFYDKMKTASTQAQAMADFAAKIVPPEKYTRSHLDRVQGMSLLAQAAAVTVDYIESNDMGRRDKAAQLEKDAQTEMLTAHAAERKLGLWGSEPQGEDSSAGGNG